MPELQEPGLVSPPGNGADLRFTTDVFFTLPRYLHALLADLAEILHCDRKCVLFCHAGPKLEGASAKKF